MKFSVITLTYGRVHHLENALACLLAQDYPGELEFLVFNSCVQQTLVFEHPMVKIINAKTRLKSLGACRNAAIEAASGDVLLVLDDDDACLPNFVSTFAKGFGEADWCQHGRQFYAEKDWIKDIVRGTLNVVGFTRAAWERAGKYSEMNTGEDRDFVGRLTATCHGRVLDLPERETSGIYCWANGAHHISGLGDDSPRNNSYARAEADLMKRLRNKTEPSGVVILKPRARCDWQALAKTYLEKHGWLREKINGVGVIQMGKIGDIINTLPICKKLHDEGKNPYLIVAREFASVLEGVSYVMPHVLDIPWVDIDRAKRVAQSQFTSVLNLQIYGKGHKQEHNTASYNMEQWREAGLLEEFHNPEMKPVFDRRDAKREALVLAKLFRTDKPKIVTNLTRSASSPFHNGPMLLSSIQTAFKNTHEVVEIGNLKLHRIYDLLAVIEKAALFISVDTATLHLAAAVNVPVIALVNDTPWLGTVVRYNDVETFRYIEATKESVLGMARDYLFPKADTKREKVVTTPIKTVSAVIAVYKPNMERLNRCLAAVLPQVDEVIVCIDNDTPRLDGVTVDEKIAFQWLGDSSTGYGKKANHGAKHATGDAILFLNDDVYLNPDTVAGLLREMRDDTAIVSHTLRYPNGMIQYGGKCRPVGARNFVDADVRKLMSRNRFVVEQESACGASMMIRRDVFEKVGGFDSRYFLYCEDDDLAMRVRQLGYRIMFTPLVEGIHEGNASMALTPGWRDILSQSQKIFAERWGFYFQLNRNPRVLGKFPTFNPMTLPAPAIIPVADDPDYTRITSSVKRLNPSMTLVYIHVPGDPEHQKQAFEFGESYMKNPPLCEHETIIVMQGDDRGSAANLLFGPIFQKFKIFRHDDSGWDIGAYIAVAKTIKTDIMLCCGGSTFFRKAGWGHRMVEAWETHGPGFYGSNAVFDVTPHINTNGFWCAPEMLALYPQPVVTKQDRYAFEHGQSSMWRILNAKGFPVKLVTWTGEFDWQEWRSQPNILRRGDQSNCLVYWHHHLIYERGGSQRRRELERVSDTMVDRALLNQKPSVTLVYIYPVGYEEHDAYAKRFVQSYVKNPPDYPHETIVVCNGGKPNDFIQDLFRDIPCRFFEHDDTGWDIGAYQSVAKHIRTDAMFCCGGLTHFKRSGWLRKMVDAWTRNGRGLYGTLGSFQYGVKHFATTGFLCPPELIQQYPKPVVTYEERAEFEHGQACITNLALKLGMQVKLVTWDGVWSLDRMRQPSNILNKGNQSNCLTYYKQTDIYDATNPQQKRLLQARVEGKLGLGL